MDLPLVPDRRVVFPSCSGLEIVTRADIVRQKSDGFPATMNGRAVVRTPRYGRCGGVAATRNGQSHEKLPFHSAEEKFDALGLITAHPKLHATIQEDFVVSMEPGVNLFHLCQIHNRRSMNANKLPRIQLRLNGRQRRP